MGARCLECAMPIRSVPAHDDALSLSPEDTAHSAALVARIADEIEGAGGWIPFDRFMERALYAPGLGYYAAGARKIGARADDGSDFTTAPERTPLFAQALARPVAMLIREGATSVLEFGGGSGALARDLLRALDVCGALPDRYEIVEPSPDLRERQQRLLAAAVPHLVARVRWLNAFPAVIDGVVLANEVLDALPVRSIVRRASGWIERGIGLRERVLAFADRPLSSDEGEHIARAIPHADLLPVDYATERHDALDAWVATLVDRMSTDAVALLIDYGFPASEYFHPQRAGGTLMAHFRHRASADLLALVGLQDLTAHVDFSAVARAATAGGAQVVGYTTQQSFLLDCGIVESMESATVDPRAWATQAAALQMLLSEAEMGELFKAIALARRPRGLPGFGRSDRRGAL